jgi:hypothetical protein
VTDLPSTPSRYRLPQSCSPDRQRARRATLELQHTRYLLTTDDGPGHPAEGFRLPVAAASLPSGESFSAEKTARLLGHKALLRLATPFIQARVPEQPASVRQYDRLLGWLRRPRPSTHWRSDAEFARQRLIGTNPMSLRRCEAPPGQEVAGAADRVLRERHRTGVQAALDAGHLFRTDYEWLLDERIQQQVAPGATLAATTCFFLREPHVGLAPLAIQLTMAGATAPTVLTPLDPPALWLLARCHAQSADAHYHEAVFHLLETHMVSEVFALCTARELHPDHPLQQLLAPHFQGTLAINHLARRDLLSPGGPIDTVMAAGVGGAMDLARLAWARWSFRRRTLEADLVDRGVDDPRALPELLYRDDARAIWKLLHRYVSRVLGAWYRSDDDVRADYELRAWLDELARFVPDFPLDIDDVATLVQLATDIIFRASAQHSAVNNGQFSSYGFVPNAPGAVFARPFCPGAVPNLDERDVLRALPNRERGLAQLGMAWVLSEPTHRSLLTAGESPAFSREFCPAAHDAVLALRRDLLVLSDAIAARNRTLAVPYSDLSPHQVARSTNV